MGLDWQPIARPKPGHEADFETIYRHIYEDVPIEVPRRKKWGLFRDQRAERADRDAARQTMLNRIDEIGVLPEEAVGAPRVGHDRNADEWLIQNTRNRRNKEIGDEELLKKLHGFYVVALAPESDGVPIYSNGWIPMGYCQPYTFRAQFFRDFGDWMGHELVQEAWTNHRAAALCDYGRRLRDKVSGFADARGIPREILDARAPLEDDEEDTPVFQAHVVMSAARWCQWWGERGHGMQAYF